MNVNLGLKEMDRKNKKDIICSTDVGKFLKMIR